MPAVARVHVEKYEQNSRKVYDYEHSPLSKRVYDIELNGSSWRTKLIHLLLLIIGARD